MQFAGDRADFGIQESLDEGVYVFVRRADAGAIGKTLGDPVEPAQELRFFLSRYNSCLTQCVHPRFARGDVLRPQPMIDGKAAIQRVERLARPRAECEAPAPHLM